MLGQSMKQSSRVCSRETDVYCSFHNHRAAWTWSNNNPSQTELHPHHPRTRVFSLTASHGRKSSPAPLSAPPRPRSPLTDLVYRQQPQGKESMVGQLCRLCPSARFPSSWHIACPGWPGSDSSQSLLPASGPSRPFTRPLPAHL